LAISLARNWTDALLAIQTNPPANWVADVLGNQAQAKILEVCAIEPALDNDQRLMMTIAVLNPALPMYWKGTQIEHSHLQENPELCFYLLESSLPEYCRTAGVHHWFQELHDRWKQVRRSLGISEACPPAAECRRAIVDLLFGDCVAGSAAASIALAATSVRLRALELSTRFAHREEHLRLLEDAIPTPPRRKSPRSWLPARPIAPIAREHHPIPPDRPGPVILPKPPYVSPDEVVSETDPVAADDVVRILWRVGRHVAPLLFYWPL
jgi:hypothetical protein